MQTRLTLTNKQAAYLYRLLSMMSDPGDADFEINKEIQAKVDKAITDKALKMVGNDYES